MSEFPKPPMTATAFDIAVNRAADELIVAIAAAKATFAARLEELFDEVDNKVPEQALVETMNRVSQRLNAAGEEMGKE